MSETHQAHFEQPLSELDNEALIQATLEALPYDKKYGDPEALLESMLGDEGFEGSPAQDACFMEVVKRTADRYGYITIRAETGDTNG